MKVVIQYLNYSFIGLIQLKFNTNYMSLLIPLVIFIINIELFYNKDFKEKTK